MAAKPYLPTPQEIHEACQRIQETWTPLERLHRRGLLVEDVQPYELPAASIRESGAVLVIETIDHPRVESGGKASR